MGLYTKQGDNGMTSLMNGSRVSKCDDRMELLGTIDELSSHIGLAKVVADEGVKKSLSRIQYELIQMMAKIADSRNSDYEFGEEQIRYLEEQIDRLEEAFPREKKFVLYGGCELSARLDVARAVARRVERRFWRVKRTYQVDTKALQYINRLSDYLYIEARYADFRSNHGLMH